MALNIKLDFDDAYELEPIGKDLSLSKFTTILQDESEVELAIQISNTAHPFLPDVYNLAFGPLTEHNQIDDHQKLTHKNHSKVFSTIMFTALTFLSKNPKKYLGIDGSNNARAYMYYRCIQNNYVYLDDFFNIFGVNYYCRILRKIKDEDPNYPIDNSDIRALPTPIGFNVNIRPDLLYNYFIFNLK